MSYRLEDIGIYNDPVLSRRRDGINTPYRRITESLTVEDNCYVILTEIANTKERVVVINGTEYLAETEDDELAEDEYRVDYSDGVVYFHPSKIGLNLSFSYLGEGVRLFPVSRIYTVDATGKISTLKDKLLDVDRQIAEQKARVDNLIINNPQPSEIVDIRVDRNGQLFTTARDRINADQAKIEEAYRDLNNVAFPSLKARIDAEQAKIDAALASDDGDAYGSLKERFDNLDNRLGAFEQNITSLEGQLTLKVSREDFNGENLVSLIELTPENILISSRKINLVGAIGVNALDDSLFNVVDNAVLQASINLTGSLPTSVIMNSSGITAYTSDPTKFARFNDQGLYIKGGAIVIDGGLPTSQLADGAKWNKNSTYMDSNGIYTGKVVANQIEATSLSAISSHLGTVETGKITAMTSDDLFIGAYGSKIDSTLEQYTGKKRFRFNVDSNTYLAIDEDNIFHLFMDGVIGVSFDQIETQKHKRLKMGNGILKSLNGSMSGMQFRNPSDSGYITVEAASFGTVSNRDFKKNIEPYTKDALSKINSTPIYSYHYNDDLDSEPKRLGVILQESPLEIVNLSGTSVDSYPMAAMAFKGIQEEDEKVERYHDELLGEIATLKSTIVSLQGRVEVLEGGTLI